MDDRLLVEALRSRAAEAPGALYDTYARRLYGYCRFRLHDGEAAEDALCDTFIAAEAHIDRLQEADRLEPWLYALARRECARRTSGDGPDAGSPDADPEVLWEVPRDGARSDQDEADQRIVAWRAVAGMPPLSREVLELRVLHRLSMPDVAAVLGLPDQDVEVLVVRATHDLEESLTAELLAARGRHECPGRAAILREQRGGLAAPLRRRLLRHAAQCAGCGALRRRAVSPVKVYRLLPEAVPPHSLRARVLSRMRDLEHAGHRESVAARATEFVRGAFPVQRDTETLPLPVAAVHQPVQGDGPPAAGGRRARPSSRWTVVVATAAGTCLVVLAAALGGRPGQQDHSTAGASPRASQTAQTPPAQRSPDTHFPADPGGWNAEAVRLSPTWPLGATDSAAPPTALLPSPPPSPDPQPGGPGRPGTPQVTGTLSVSPRYLDLGGGTYGSVELLAQGGPVDWRARPTRGRVRLSAVSGRLAPGRPVTLWLRPLRRLGSSGQEVIVFRPGGVRVVVTWRKVPRRPRPSPTRTPSPPQPPPTTTSRPETPPHHPAPSEPSTPPSTPPASAPPEPPPSPPASSGPPASPTTPEPPPSSGPSPVPEPDVT